MRTNQRLSGLVVLRMEEKIVSRRKQLTVGFCGLSVVKINVMSLLLLIVSVRDTVILVRHMIHVWKEHGDCGENYFPVQL